MTHHLLVSAGLSPNNLDGQVAIVTGAGSGIGLAAAHALASLGARVVIAELDTTRGENAEALIHDAGNQALFVQTDVSSASSVAALAEKVRETYGPVSILVNNAITIQEAAVMEMSVEDWDRTIAVNLRGIFLTCRQFLPDMLSRQRGTIVNMTSTEAMPGLSAYIASKQGIVGFSQSLALEMGDEGVYVIPFAPGMVDTPGMRSVATGLAPRLGMTEAEFLSVSLHPAFEGLMPVEYAGVATAYLIAKLADEFHGEVIDGYAVLERAGLVEAPSAPGLVIDRPIPPTTGQALELSRQLEEIIAQTGAEFERLPVFVRPLARRGFKSKAGQSLQDWARTAATLVTHLEEGTPIPDLPRIVALMDQLVTYYEGVPAETARFTRDAEMLREVEQISCDRIAVIRALGEKLQQF
jgi:NAD(P)-dependent dehydrogenase (short-subunit alcohol dehydrogenase family)